MIITSDQIISGLIGCFGGGGTGWAVAKTIIKNAAKEAVKDDIDTINKKIDRIEENYVTCKFCTMQHDNLTETLKSMDSKLDILINKG